MVLRGPVFNEPAHDPFNRRDQHLDDPQQYIQSHVTLLYTAGRMTTVGIDTPDLFGDTGTLSKYITADLSIRPALVRRFGEKEIRPCDS